MENEQKIVKFPIQPSVDSETDIDQYINQYIVYERNKDFISDKLEEYFEKEGEIFTEVLRLPSHIDNLLDQKIRFDLERYSETGFFEDLEKAEAKMEREIFGDYPIS